MHGLLIWGQTQNAQTGGMHSLPSPATGGQRFPASKAASSHNKANWAVSRKCCLTISCYNYLLIGKQLQWELS